MSRALYPIPSFAKGDNDPLQPHTIVDERGMPVGYGFPTIHHAWAWIIGPSYRWPRHPITPQSIAKAEAKRHNRRRSPRHNAKRS
jgi:hypothetical protein